MGDPEIFFSHIFWQNLLPGNVKQSQSLLHTCLETFQKAVETLPPLVLFEAPYLVARAGLGLAGRAMKVFFYNMQSIDEISVQVLQALQG